VQLFTIQDILAHEDEWPERVVRQPLTEADRANGFTGGSVETIDVRRTNEAALEVDAFDLRAEWPIAFRDGRLRFYADATYQKRNVRKNRFEPGIPLAGYLEGPLKRRANGGFDWSKNQLKLGVNLQYFSSSLIFGREFANDPELVNDEGVLIQGSTRIPSQTYLDLYGSWRLQTESLGPVDSLQFDFGIVNVFDKAPPRESVAITLFGPSYSRYGDPRLRRFELGVSCHF
jgi:hypothetical protein